MRNAKRKCVTDAMALDGDDDPTLARLASACASCTPIPRVAAEDLTSQRFQQEFFSRARPVVITGATDGWPAREWTIDNLVERVGDNQVVLQSHHDCSATGEPMFVLFR